MSESRVMFVGKYPGSGALRRFQELGRALGYAAAESGLGIVVGSESERTLDGAVIAGAGAFARDSSRSVRWFVYEPDDGKRRFATFPDGLPPPRRWLFPVGPDARWENAHVEAALDSHAVVALGGSANTHRACRVGEESGIPVWPLPYFGGAARERFEALTAELDGEETAASPRHAEELRDAYSDAAGGNPKFVARAWIARIVGGLKRKLRRRRLYFICYARANNDAADHVEALLHRHKRGVLRDEITFAPSGKVPDETIKTIRAADDVLVLDSAVAASRSSVQFEIQTAYELATRIARPERILGILLEGHPPRTNLDPKVLHLAGQTRPERDLAIARIVRTEKKKRGP